MRPDPAEIYKSKRASVFYHPALLGDLFIEFPRMLTCPMRVAGRERTGAATSFLLPGQSRQRQGGIFQAASRPKFSYNLVTSASWRRNVGSRRVISVAENLWRKNTVESYKQAAESFSLRKVSVSGSVKSLPAWDKIPRKLEWKVGNKRAAVVRVD